MNIGKIAGAVSNGLASSKAVQNVCRKGAKYLKKAPVLDVAGVKTNYMTGTQFTKLADGTKSIVFGSGNRLSKLLGKPSVISYPKGTFMGGENGLIVIAGKQGALSFTPKEFGDYINILQKLNKFYGK